MNTLTNGDGNARRQLPTSIVRSPMTALAAQLCGFDPIVDVATDAAIDTDRERQEQEQSAKAELERMTRGIK